ncbi:MAG: M14 family zinc carboxypeptidase [Phycisphaerales bacterium]
MIASFVLALQAGSTAAPPSAPAAAPAAPAPAAPAPVVVPVERRTAAQLAEAVAALQSRFPNLVGARPLGTSVGRLPLTMLQLSADAATAGDRPAILVVAGMDGVRWSSTEAALVMAEVLARDHADLLREVTYYILPCANPDAAERIATGLRRDSAANALPHDNDRDRKMDEDGPRDLNGDGAITQMRVAGSLPPWTHPSLVPDPAEPRMMKKADATKGETPVYTIWTEGIDADADGRIAEDGPGGINIDRNFPHRWPEFEDEAGAYPLIAPESKAIADFVIANPRLVAAIVLGRTDTVVNLPDAKARAEQNMPMILDEADLPAYTEVAKVYRELLGQKRASGSDTAGSLIAWMNAQRGVPTFGAQLWGRPDLPPKEGAKDGAKDEAKPAPRDGGGDAPRPPADAAPAGARPDAGAADAPRGPGARGQGGGGPGAQGGRMRRGGGGAPPARRNEGNAEAAKPMDEEDAAWLAYSDQVRGGTGFLPWAKTKHPQLGEVEIGGWIPGFRENPPLEEVRALGEKSGTFAARLAEFRPKVELRSPKVTQLGPGLYRVDVELVNSGRLPTVERGGRAESVTPAHLVRISPPVDRVKSGRRSDIVRGMDPGEVRSYDWIVAAAPEEVVEIELLYAGRPIARAAFRDGVPVDPPPTPAAAAPAATTAPAAAPAAKGGAK